MKNYYKYTSGESFTLNGEDYHGFFHVVDDIVYSGKFLDSAADILTPKKTLLSEIYTSKMELDNVYTHIDTIIPNYSNVFDIINKQGIDRMMKTINYNNLTMFSGGIIGNPVLYNTTKNDNPYYGFTSDQQYSTSLSSKKNSFDIIPFSYNPTWGFLDDITSGVFVVGDDEQFKYLCTSGITNYIIGGSFNGGELTVIDFEELHPDNATSPDYTYSIHYDEEDSKIIYVNDDYMKVYDASTFYNCDNLILIDKIKLFPNITTNNTTISTSTSTIDYIWNKVSMSYRETPAKWGDRFIKYINTTTTTKTTQATTQTISPGVESGIDYNNVIYTMIDAGSINKYKRFIKFGKHIRTFVDGISLHIIGKYSSTIYKTLDVSKFNISNILDMDVSPVDDSIIILHTKSYGLYVTHFTDIEDLNLTPKITKIESILLGMPWYKIKFSSIDSNVFYISNTKEYQGRYLSYPAYPYGRLERGDMHYFEKWKWNDAFQKYGQSDIIFNKVSEGSTSYTNLASCELVRNGKMYMILHNVGRIYTLSQPITERFSPNVPMDLIKYTNPVQCSDTSIGLYFNTIILNNIKDTLNIFNKTSGSFEFEEYDVKSLPITDLEYDIKDFYINGNETLNVATIQRILLSVTELQSKIIPIMGGINISPITTPNNDITSPIDISTTSIIDIDISIYDNAISSSDSELRKLMDDIVTRFPNTKTRHLSQINLFYRRTLLIVDLLKSNNISTSMESKISDFMAEIGYAWYDDYRRILGIETSTESILAKNKIQATSEIINIGNTISQLVMEGKLESIVYYIALMKKNGHPTSDLEAQLDYFYSVWNKEANPYLSRPSVPSDEIIYNTENPNRDNARYVGRYGNLMSDMKMLNIISDNMEYLARVKYRLPL